VPGSSPGGVTTSQSLSQASAISAVASLIVLEFVTNPSDWSTLFSGSTVNQRIGRVGGSSITDYHAKLFAYQLTQRVQGDQTERLTTSIMDSSVDLNPHQIDAALFAFQS